MTRKYEDQVYYYSRWNSQKCEGRNVLKRKKTSLKGLLQFSLCVCFLLTFFADINHFCGHVNLIFTLLPSKCFPFSPLPLGAMGQFLDFRALFSPGFIRVARIEMTKKVSSLLWETLFELVWVWESGIIPTTLISGEQVSALCSQFTSAYGFAVWSHFLIFELLSCPLIDHGMTWLNLNCSLLWSVYLMQFHYSMA